MAVRTILGSALKVFSTDWTGDRGHQLSVLGREILSAGSQASTKKGRALMDSEALTRAVQFLGLSAVLWTAYQITRRLRR